MAAERERLIAEGHVERLQNCTDDQFVSPIVITVKRDGSIKLALDSKELNKMESKNKNQMPNIEDLMDRIADVFYSKTSGAVWFTSIDLRYAYGQLLLAMAVMLDSVISVWSVGPQPELIGFSGIRHSCVNPFGHYNDKQRSFSGQQNMTPRYKIFSRQVCQELALRCSRRNLLNVRCDAKTTIIVDTNSICFEISQFGRKPVQY